MAPTVKTRSVSLAPRNDAFIVGGVANADEERRLGALADRTGHPDDNDPEPTPTGT